MRAGEGAPREGATRRVGSGDAAQQSTWGAARSPPGTAFRGAAPSIRQSTEEALAPSPLPPHVGESERTEIEVVPSSLPTHSKWL